MDFMTCCFQNNCFQKLKKLFFILPFSLFYVYLIPILINERPHTTLLAFEEGSIEYILRGKILLYGFDSIFSQVSIEFLFVSICCSFCIFLQPRKKLNNDRSWCPLIKRYVIKNMLDLFSCYLMVFIILKLIVFNFAVLFNIFCLIVTKT